LRYDRLVRESGTVAAAKAPAAETERVAVLIVNWNSRDLLARCLAAVRGQTRPAERVIVIDNASTDGSVALAEAADPTAEIVRLERNRGFAAASNVGIAMAGDCQWIAFLNPDAFPEPGWLEALTRSARAHPGYTSFASQMRSAREDGRLDGTGDVYHVSGAAWRAQYGQPFALAPTACREVFSACAAAALHRRDALLEAGGFDESYFCYLEDVDLGFRLRLAGHRCLYVPDAVVDHVGWGTTDRRSAVSVYHGHRNLVWTYFKNMPASLLVLYLPQHLLLNLATVAWFAWRGQGRVILKAKWDAFRGLPRVLRDRPRTQAHRRLGAWALRRSLLTGCLAPYRARMLR
jgi:GT2 family glycosyltransferase